jgi:hypothetical protein
MAEDSLTGVWNGLYTYQDGNSTAFVATLIESGAVFTGMTHEKSAVSGGTMLFANLDGACRGRTVSFTKIYDPPDELHCHRIHYEGALNGDATEIEGRWTIPQACAGKFLMVRSGGRTATVERKAFEKA